MKNILSKLSCIGLLISTVSSCQSKEEKQASAIIGTYNISTKIISQFDNKETVGLYTITIESDQKAILSIKADHVEDYWCEGDYHLIKEDNILHAKGKCDEDDMDDLYIKNENGKFYIKSKRFVNQDWQELKSN